MTRPVRYGQLDSPCQVRDISYVTVLLSGHALKHFKTVGIWWGILEWGLLHFTGVVHSRKYRIKSLTEVIRSEYRFHLRYKFKFLYLDTLLWANGYFSLQDLDNVPNIKKVHLVRDITLGLNDSCILSPGALQRLCMNPWPCRFTQIHSQKKEMQLSNILRGAFPSPYMYSNFWVLRENCKQFWNGFFWTLSPRA